MTLGSVSSLGVGSGFELQQMLDDLRAADEVTLDIKENEKTRLTEQVVEFDALNAKILQMKSDALALSLESNFIERKAATDETVALANVQSGAALSSYLLSIDRLASKSSWQTDTGVTDTSAAMVEAPATSLTSTEPAVPETTSLSFTIEHETGQKTITLNLEANSSIDAIVAAINAEDANQNGGTTYVTATAVAGENGSYIRLSSTDKNTTQNNEIIVSDGPGFITPDLTFSYQVEEGSDPVYVSVSAGTSYENIISMINNDPNNSGMTAAMINTGISDTPWYMTFTADQSGEDGRIVLSDSLTMTEVRGGDGEGSLNASFSIDGYTYQRQSNSGINDIIQGVSLTLKKSGSTQVSVSPSTDTMKENIIHLIEIYNEINEDIDLKTSYATNEKDEGGILSNVHSLKSLDSILFNLLNTMVDTGTGITSLADIGMETNRNGTITLDQDILNEAFSSSLDEITALFIGDSENGIKGLAETLNERLRSMSNSSTGIVSAEKNTVQKKIDNLTDSIETATQRLDRKYDQMAKQFIQLDAFIGRMNSQANYLAGMIESFNTTSSNK